MTIVKIYRDFYVATLVEDYIDIYIHLEVKFILIRSDNKVFKFQFSVKILIISFVPYRNYLKKISERHFSIRKRLGFNDYILFCYSKINPYKNKY